MSLGTAPANDVVGPRSLSGVAQQSTTAQAPTRQRLRLGFLTRLETGDDAADSYRVALDLFQAAEALGFDTGWIAQHHFLNGDGRLPSAFPFLAAAAELTKRIGLGTAVVTLPLEDPLRVAEDAAFVDTLSGGRLQLGLGTGGDPLTFSAFGKDVEARREQYAEGLRIVQEALAGRPINGTHATLYPPAPTLASRIWEATFSESGGARIGRNGSGLLVARTAALSHQPADVAQLPLAQAYLAEIAQRGEAPRLGLSRTVYAAADRRTAIAHLDGGISKWIDTMIGRGAFPRGLTQEEYYRRIFVHYGHPEEVVQSVQADLLFPMTTELICQVQPGHPTASQIAKSLELIATQVGPALGWQPQKEDPIVTVSTSSPASVGAPATDVISALAGVAPDSTLAELRAQRPEATEHAQGSYAALFDPAESTGLTPCERFAVALRVATTHAATQAADHYRARLVATGCVSEVVAATEGVPGADVPVRLKAILAHADLLGSHPVDATPDSLQALADAGLSTAEIVTLSQLIAFVSFQVRVISGLRLLAGPSAASTANFGASASRGGAIPGERGAPATIVRPTEPLKRPPAFTRDQLAWTPWLEPLDPVNATPAQAAALAGRPGNSPYFRLLALDPTVLTERTATDLGIFYTHGGAPRAERELAAAATSRLNGCIFCASVHARTAAQLSKREADVDRLLDRGIESLPALELDERWTAVVDLAVNFARTPSTATPAHVNRLREIGLAQLEILDILQAAAFFSWANRLMLTLGEPYYAEAATA